MSEGGLESREPLGQLCYPACRYMWAREPMTVLSLFYRYLVSAHMFYLKELQVFDEDIYFPNDICIYVYIKYIIMYIFVINN